MVARPGNSASTAAATARPTSAWQSQPQCMPSGLHRPPAQVAGGDRGHVDHGYALAPTPRPRRGHGRRVRRWRPRRRAAPGAAAAGCRAPARRGGSSARRRRTSERYSSVSRCGSVRQRPPVSRAPDRLGGAVRGPGGPPQRRRPEVGDALAQVGRQHRGQVVHPTDGEQYRLGPRQQHRVDESGPWSAPTRRPGPSSRGGRRGRGWCRARRRPRSRTGRDGSPARRAPGRGRPASRRRPAGSPRLPVSAPARRRRPPTSAADTSTAADRSVRSGQPGDRRAEPVRRCARAAASRARPSDSSLQRPLPSGPTAPPARDRQPEQPTGQGHRGRAVGDQHDRLARPAPASAASDPLAELGPRLAAGLAVRPGRPASARTAPGGAGHLVTGQPLPLAERSLPQPPVERSPAARAARPAGARSRTARRRSEETIAAGRAGGQQPRPTPPPAPARPRPAAGRPGPGSGARRSSGPAVPPQQDAARRSGRARTRQGSWRQAITRCRPARAATGRRTGSSGSPSTAARGRRTRAPRRAARARPRRRSRAAPSGPRARPRAAPA